MKDTNKEKVLIYAVYSENNMDFCIQKDNSLNNYCNDKKYRVIEIVRKPLPYQFLSVIEDFVKLTKKNNFNNSFSKVIVYDIKEIALNNSCLLTLLTILKEKEIELESIVQGRLNFNPLDKEDILGDDYLFENYLCSKNKKYFVEEESLFD